MVRCLRPYAVSATVNCAAGTGATDTETPVCDLIPGFLCLWRGAVYAFAKYASGGISTSSTSSGVFSLKRGKWTVAVARASSASASRCVGAGGAVRTVRTGGSRMIVRASVGAPGTSRDSGFRLTTIVVMVPGEDRDTTGYQGPSYPRSNSGYVVRPVAGELP